MSNPDSNPAALIGAGIQALLDNARRLGLTWDMSLATVTGVTQSGPVIRMDGDTTDIGANTMIGSVSMGERVYVITVPPAGNYITGRVSTDALTQESLYQYWMASITNTGSIGTVLTTVMTGAAFTFKAQRAYRATLRGTIACSATTNVGSFTVNTPEHGVIWSLGWFGPDLGAGGRPASVLAQTILRVTGVNDEVVTSIFVQMVASAGTVIWATGLSLPRFFALEEVGAAADFPSAFDLS